MTRAAPLFNEYKYRPVRAVQITFENISHLERTLKGSIKGLSLDHSEWELELYNDSLVMRGKIGDYVVAGVDNVYYPMSKDQFHQIFEKLDG